MEDNHQWVIEAEDESQIGIEVEVRVDQEELIEMANIIGHHLVPHLLLRG